MSKKKGQTKVLGVHSSLQDQLLGKGLASQDQIPEARESVRPQYKQTHELFCMAQTRLPRDTREVLSDIEPDNFALKLNRRVWFQEEKGKQKPVLYKKIEKNGICSVYNVSFDFDLKRIKEISNRQLFAIQNSGLECRVMDFSIDWRFVIGLGNESVYETSMTLHHVYGFPYIPGSSVKGVIRSWIITELYGEIVDDDSKRTLDLKHAEERALDDEGFRNIFGDTEAAGKIRFFDAFPITAPKVDTDIMNPHFGEYYGDQTNTKPPADYLTPVPLPFLTVKETTYRFIIGVRKEDNMVMHGVIGQGCSRLEVASRWLEKALTCHGIGAKTAVGYGYMTQQRQRS
jgi:CRISPR-associated protein Cmr6